MTKKLATTTHPIHGVKHRGNGESGTMDESSRALKDGIAQSLAGLSTIESDIAALVRKTVADALRLGGVSAGDMVNVVHHVVMGAIGAVEQVGTGLTMSIKSVAKGIVMGVHDVGGDVVHASAETLRSVIKHAAIVGSDVGVVAKRAVDGVIEATVDIGGNVAQVGMSAIEGAIEEAGTIGNMAVKTVRDVLSAIRSDLGEASATPQHHAAAKKSHASKSH